MKNWRIVALVTLALVVSLASLVESSGLALADKGDKRDHGRAAQVGERAREEAKEARERAREEARESREHAKEAARAARHEDKEAKKQRKRRTFQGEIVKVAVAQAATTGTGPATGSAGATTSTTTSTAATGTAGGVPRIVGTLEIKPRNDATVAFQITSNTKIRVPGLKTIQLSQLMAGDWVAVTTAKPPASNGQRIAKHVLVNPGRSHIVRVNGVVLEPAAQTRPPLATLKVRSERFGEVTFGAGLATGSYLLPEEKSTVGQGDQVQVVARRLAAAATPPVTGTLPGTVPGTLPGTIPAPNTPSVQWIVLGVKVHEPD